MPKSRTRKHHHAYQPPSGAFRSKKNRSAVTASIVLVALAGMGIAWFAGGDSDAWLLWLTAGAVVGAILGYYFGHQIDRSMSKK